MQEEIKKTLKGHAGMYADNPLVISAMEFTLSQALKKRDSEIIEHIIKSIQEDPEIKIPREYSAAWILTNLQFYKAGEHQSPWFKNIIKL